MKHDTGLETCTRIYFLFTSTLCKWEFVKPRYFDFQFDEVTVKTLETQYRNQ